MPSRIGLRELRAAARPGECPFCGEPAKRRSQSPDAVRKRKQRGVSDYYGHCGDEECKRAYLRYDQRDRRPSARRTVVGRRFRSSRGDGQESKLVLYAEELECGHLRLYKTNGGKPSEVRLCRECLLDNQN